MRFTINTPDGETYTTPEDAYPLLDNEGTGALHIIRSGSDRTIAVFPAGQWTRYVPTDEDAGEHHTETWDELLNAVWTVIEAKSKQLSNGQFYIVGDEANLYRAYRNATKHNKSGIR
ncbi:hypothetical protein [Corynebacterium variabile]|uniref:hypothetical protein n=1 Tax=Corynebacterium variabile TaxID=1727 RepID=UPI00289C7D6B|nr:hypothetical protein [Corynebacterium variabile]